MKKFLPQFFDRLFYNLLFWGVLGGVYYYLKHQYLKQGIIAVVIVSAAVAANEAVKNMTKKSNKTAKHIAKAVSGIIYLYFDSACIVFMAVNIETRDTKIAFLFFAYALVFYYMVSKNFDTLKGNA